MIQLKKYCRNVLKLEFFSAWGVTQGHSVLPKSKTPSRIQSNLKGDFRLSSSDMEKIKYIDKKIRFNDSSAEFGREFFTDLDGK